MGFKSNSQKFKKHLSDGGLVYACKRGVKYFVFLLRKKRGLVESYRREAISKGGLKIVYGQKEGLGIFWKARELTQKPGLNCAVHTLGFWTDSSKADWQLIEKKENSLKIKIFFNELPLAQIWTIVLEDNQAFSWSVDIEAQECLYFDEFRIISVIVNKYKTWVSGYVQKNFPRPDDQWRDLYVGDESSSLVAVRSPLGDGPPPCLAIETTQDQDDFSALVQSPPLNHSAYLIGFRKPISEGERKLPQGISRIFSGIITISETDDFLDARVEVLRQNDYEKRLRFDQ